MNLRRLDNKILEEIKERLGKVSGLIRDIENLRERDLRSIDLLAQSYEMICREVDVTDQGDPKTMRDKKMMILGSAICDQIHRLERGL